MVTKLAKMANPSHWVRKLEDQNSMVLFNLGMAESKRLRLLQKFLLIWMVCFCRLFNSMGQKLMGKKKKKKLERYWSENIVMLEKIKTNLKFLVRFVLTSKC